MTVSVVPRKKTIEDAPFTFVIEDSQLHGVDGALYVVDCLIDGYHICGIGFMSKQADYEANLKTAIADTKAKALSKLESMRAEIARMQAVVDKVANYAD